MHATKNDLPEASRQSAVKLLQACLADAVDLTSQTKQAHWNVKGPNFMTLHELFDRLHDEMGDASDLIAERLVALGGQAYGTIREAVSRSNLAEYPVEISSGQDHVEALSTALAQFGGSVRAAIDAAADLEDQGTSDLFTEISRSIDQALWLVEAHGTA